MAPCLRFEPLDLLSRGLKFAFVSAEEDLFGSPCTLHDFIDTTSYLRIDVALSLPLRLHVDWGLDRHGYPWVPTDQCPRGPCQVGPTYQKPNQPASGPRDLIYDPGDPRRPLMTLSRPQTTCQA
jgi:hypothetical protein